MPHRPGLVQLTYVVDFLRTLNAGTERQLGYLLRHMPDHGYDLSVISLQDSPFLSHEASAVFPRVRFRSLGATSDITESLGKFWQIARILRAERPQLVHTFFPASNGVGVMVARLSGVRAIVSSRRDMGYHLTRKDIFSLKLANRFVSCVVANSEAVRDKAMAIEGLAPSKMAVIYNGISHDQFPEGGLSSRTDRPVIGIVANLNRSVKRVDLFIRGAALVYQRFPGVAFRVIGDGDLRPDLENLASNLGIHDQIEFLGRRDDIREVLGELSIGVICSDSEGFSNSIMEYMLSGLPVVATATGGNPELIQDGETGLLVEPGNPEALAHALVRLLEDQEFALKLGHQARESIRSRFSTERMIAETCSLYSRIATGTGEDRGSGP